MSVSIITKTKKGKIGEIPVSTERLFHEYWLLLFEKHEMENLSNLRFSHDLEKEELKNIIHELSSLIPHIKGEWEIERAKFILSELKFINFDDYEFINIG